MYALTSPLNYCRPSLVDGPNQGSPVVGRAYPYPPYIGNASASFHAGDFLALAHVGTLTYPVPAGTIAAVQPTAIPTVAYTATGSTNARTLYYYYTYEYSSSTGESLPSPWFTLPMPAGNTATITVPSAGAPAAATGFNTYIGYNPYQAWQQVAATSLGSAAAVPTGNALTNYSGCIRSANDPSANILGIALDDYDILFTNIAQATGGGTFSSQLLFGPDMTSLDPEQYQAKFAKVSNGQQFVISTASVSSQGLLYSVAGIEYSTSQNVFYLNPQTNNACTIVGIDDNLDNWPASQPFDTGLIGAQVIAIFNAGTLA
jgi:hypothetical protein